MTHAGRERLSKKEIAHLWGVCERTARKDIRVFGQGVKPADFIGLTPLYAMADVETISERRRRARMKQLGY